MNFMDFIKDAREKLASEQPEQITPAEPDVAVVPDEPAEPDVAVVPDEPAE